MPYESAPQLAALRVPDAYAVVVRPAGNQVSVSRICNRNELIRQVRGHRDQLVLSFMRINPGH
jgi:hypothetical protein